MTKHTVPSLEATNHCRSCRAPIVYATTAKQKLIPVEVTPDPNGNLTLSGDTAGHYTATVPTRGQQAAMKAAGHPLYLSHFVNCPNAGDWRNHR